MRRGVYRTFVLMQNLSGGVTKEREGECRCNFYCGARRALFYNDFR